MAPHTSLPQDPDPLDGLADTLSPHAQALLVLSSLSQHQRAAYRRSSGLPEESSDDELALHFSEHRLAALQESAAFRERVERWESSTRKQRARGQRTRPAPSVPAAAAEELGGARVVRQRAARHWAALGRWCVRIGFVTGWAFLVLGVLGWISSLGLLLGLAAVCLAVSFLSLFVVSTAAEAAGYRRARAALVDWAVQRPGQLERGLPSLGTRAESRSAGMLEGCLGIVALAVAIFCVPMTVLMFVIALLDQQASTWQITGILAGAALLGILGPRVMSVRTWLIGRRVRRTDEALAWVYAAGAAEPSVWEDTP